MTTVHPVALVYFSYSWDTGVVHPQQEYRATVRDHSESTERFLPAAAIGSLGSFTRDEDALHALRVHRGEYVRDKSLGVPREVAAEDFDVAYDGSLNDGVWAVADIESTHGSTVAGRAKEISESFCQFSKLSRRSVWRSHEICWSCCLA